MFNSECNICKEKKEEMMREITEKFEISKKTWKHFLIVWKKFSNINNYNKIFTLLSARHL